MRVGGLLIGSIVALAITASPASAWYATGTTAYEHIGQVVVYGLSGEQHDVTATGLPGQHGVPLVDLDTSLPYADSVVIHDSAAPVTPPPAGQGGGCTVIDDHTEQCHGFDYRLATDTYVDGGVYYLNFRYDTSSQATVEVPAESAPMYAEADTGPGNDVVEFDDLNDGSAVLGDGNDRLVVRGGQGAAERGDQVISGGPGDDTLDVLNGQRDNVTCGDGNDTLRGDQSDANADCETQQLFPTP
jgi:hypothetical protein